MSTARQAALALTLAATALLAFAPVAVLGPAIGWPASLARPPAEQMAAIAAAPGAVAAGYGLYLLYSVLIAPAIAGLAARTFGGLQGALAGTVAAFGALSALARAAGIVRWLSVLPALARQHAEADAAQRPLLEAVFAGVSGYGGAVGELLGVSLFMALALGLLCAGGWRRGVMPAWLALPGLVCVVLLAALMLPALQLPLQVPVALPVSLLSLWLLAAAGWCWRRG